MFVVFYKKSSPFSPSYETYQSIINSINDKLVVVKIETKTCRGCQYLAPGLDELANAYPDQLIILNADYKIVPEPMYEFNCKRVPTIVVYYQGTVVDGPYVSTNITEIEEHLEKLSYLVV